MRHLSRAGLWPTFRPVLRAACLRIRKETLDKHLKPFMTPCPAVPVEEKTNSQSNLSEDARPAGPSLDHPVASRSFYSVSALPLATCLSFLSAEIEQ